MSESTSALRLVTLDKSAKSSPPARKTNLSARSREYLTLAEVKLLREAAGKSRNGLRDGMLILVMFRHGLRVSELCDLTWDDVLFDDGTLAARRRKNGRDSRHFMEADETRALKRMKREQPPSRFVFCSERGGPLSVRTAHHIVAQAGKAAGLPFSVHPHMLRHAKGYQLAAKGTDTRAIQGYLGHRCISSTVIYTDMDPNRYAGFGKDI